MRLQNRPRTLLESADVINGLKNSLGNSFADPSHVSQYTDDLLDSTIDCNSKCPSLTLPKEVRIGIYQLKEDCKKISNFDANFHCDLSGKELLMRRRENNCLYSTSNFSDGFCKIGPDVVRKVNRDGKKMIDKNVLNVRNAVNKMKHFDVGENVPCKVLSKVEKELSFSLLLHEKNVVEKINATRKELLLQSFEPKSQNTERKNLEGLLDGKRCRKKDTKEETSPKQVDVGSEWKESNEKGQLDTISTEKMVLMEEGVKKLREIDDLGRCSGDDRKVELLSGETARETEEICSLCEKWECEEEEKVETGRTMSLNGELENEKRVDYENPDEAYEYSKVQIHNTNIQEVVNPDEAYEYSNVVIEDVIEEKNCMKNETVSLIGQCSSTVDFCESEKGEQEVNAPGSERIDSVINGQQPCFAVSHLRLQIAEEEVGLGIPGRGNEEDVFCPSPTRTVGAFGSFKSYGGNLITTESCPHYSWICVLYSPAEPACRKSPVSHSDEGQGRSNHASSSFGCYGGEGSYGGAGFVSSGLGGGGGSGGGSGGGGNGQGGDDDRNGRNNRRRLEFSDGSRKGKAKKKLKKKCPLEHGVLTKEQISAAIGWLVERQDRSVPDTLREFLKCFKICFEDRTDARSDCEPCLALCVLLTHCGGCSADACDRCDIVLALYAVSLLADKNGLVLSPSPLLTPDARRNGLRRMRADLVEWLSSDEVSTGSEGDGSLSDFDSESKEETKDHVDSQPVAIIQGPPAINDSEDEHCVSEYPCYPNYLSSNTAPGRPCLYSVPAYPCYARRGSVIYGSKDLVRSIARQLNDVAGEQRDNRQNTPLRQQLVSRVGVILQLHSGNLRIQSNNYELGMEWNFLTDKALGSGVSGSCFVGHDDQTNFSFCVKRIQIHKFNASEVLIWLDMEHQDIAEFYGIVAYDEYVFILQELIIGPTLKERIMTNKALNTFEALTYLQHLLTLLEYLKRKGVMHNDIKADNLLLREPFASTRLVLIDFGLANQTVFVPSGVPPEGGQTQWSPEKAASEGYSFPADLWAAVAVFVHMLAGTEPWVMRFKTAGYLHFIIKQHSPPLQDIPEDIPQEVRDLVVSGWTVDPSVRPTAADLLNHEAFRLLDLYEPSADLFTRHLSAVGSAEQEDEPNVAEILDESDTEELISLVQQRFSINQSFPENQRMSTSIRMQFDSTAPRYMSSGSLILGERPPAFETSGVFHPIDPVMSLRTGALTSLISMLPRLEEETQDLIAEEVAGSSFGFAPKNNSPKSSRRISSMLLKEDDLEDLMAKYDDLSLPGFFGAPGLLNIPEDGEVLSSNRPETASSQQTSVLLNSIVGSAPIPAGVAEQSAASDDEDTMMLRSNEDKKDYVDSKEKGCCRATSMDDQPISMGTTIRMYLGDVQVYCIHLHPGTESSWSEIFRRASTEIHRRDVAAFTAKLRVGDQTEAIDISSVIPSEHELQVVIVLLNPFQEHGWTWRVEDSRITYHASYQWNFSPEYD